MPAAAACQQRGRGVREQRVGSATVVGMAVAAATTRDPSVAAEGCVLMTPGGQGPCAGVGQGPCAPKVERHVLPIASGPVKVGGEARSEWAGGGGGRVYGSGSNFIVWGQAGG